VRPTITSSIWMGECSKNNRKLQALTMHIRTRAILITSEDTGFQGLRIAKWKFGSPGSGLTFAHDLLEHCPNDKGTVEEEFMAFGAMAFIRGCGGYWHQRRSIYWHFHEQVEHEVHELVSGIDSEGNDLPECRKLLRKVSVSDESYKDYLEEEIAGLREALKDKSTAENGWITDIHANAERAFDWMRKGFAKAYDRHGVPHWILETFNQVEELADGIIRNFAGYEGQKFHVSIDTDRVLVDIRPVGHVE
jgi:hypothetical protein